MNEKLSTGIQRIHLHNLRMFCILQVILIYNTFKRFYFKKQFLFFLYFMVPFLLKLQFCRILNQGKQKEMLSRRNYIVLWLQQYWQVKSVHRFLKQKIQKVLRKKNQPPHIKHISKTSISF